MSGYKKMVWTSNKAALGSLLPTLYTDLSDEISCILSQNHNIYGEEWCLSAMAKMSIEVKKCVGNAFSRDAHHGGTSGDTDLADIKEAQSLRKKRL